MSKMQALVTSNPPSRTFRHPEGDDVDRRAKIILIQFKIVDCVIEWIEGKGQRFCVDFVIPLSPSRSNSGPPPEVAKESNLVNSALEEVPSHTE